MFSITTNRVRDAVKVTEGTESMILRVDFDPMAFVRVLETAKAKLAAVRYAQDDTTAQVVQAARDFASAIFGGEQAGRLLDFYGGHGAPVISICSRYLRGRLVKKVIRAQRAKR